MALPVKIDLLQADWDEVLQTAAAENKFLYLAFLGEDWSAAGKRFKQTVLETDAFRQFAEATLIYCGVAAKRPDRLEKSAAARLQALVIHFDIKSYPTLILVGPDGAEVIRHGFRDTTPEEYVGLLEALLPAAYLEPTRD